MEDIAYQVNHFLKEKPPQIVADGIPYSGILNKAGLLPFLPAARMEDWQVYVMQPVAAHPELSPPKFQLCKGTRMTYDGAWRDMKAGEPVTDHAEALAATALREGIEELGLVLDNIAQWWELGDVAFRSATTGKEKWLRFFAAQMHRADHFLPHEAVAATTAARIWLPLHEFERTGRPDHVHMAKTALESLSYCI